MCLSVCVCVCVCVCVPICLSVYVPVSRVCDQYLSPFASQSIWWVSFAESFQRLSADVYIIQSDVSAHSLGR